MHLDNLPSVHDARGNRVPDPAIFGGEFTQKLDRAIFAVSPRRAARRLQARALMHATRIQLGYAASYATRERQISSAPLTSEEAQLPGWTRFQLIQEAQDLYRNDAIIGALVDGKTRRIIGNGIHPHYIGRDKAWGREMRAQWNEWCDQCDVRGISDMLAIQKFCVAVPHFSGDLGVMFVDGPEIGADDDGTLIHDLRLQLIEGDLIARDYRVTVALDHMNEYTWGKDSAYPNHVSWEMGGVLINKGDGSIDGYLVGERAATGLLVNVKPIPATDMQLVFRAKRPDQVRGVPLLARVLTIARDLNSYLNACRIAANAQAMMAMFIERNNAGQFQLADSTAGMKVGNPEIGMTDFRGKKMQPGEIMYGNPGEGVKFLTAAHAGQDFDPFARFLVREIAVGCEYSYEWLMQDWGNLNYSQAKGAATEIDDINSDWIHALKRKFLRKAYPKWVARRVRAGLLEDIGDEIYNIKWTGRGKLALDPNQDAETIATRLRTLQITLPQLYAELGLDDRMEEIISGQIDFLSYVEEECAKKGVNPDAVYTALLPGQGTQTNGGMGERANGSAASTKSTPSTEKANA